MSALCDLSAIRFVGVDNPPTGERAATHREALTRPRPTNGHSRESAELDPLLAWILTRSGLDPRCYRPSALQRRTAACLRQLRAVDARAAMSIIERDERLQTIALSSVLIGVTQFFRDAAVFDYIEHAIVPSLISSQGGVRALSLGCSDGRELYSLGMLLSEAGALASSELTGVDCRSDAIDAAHLGVFNELEGVSAKRRGLHFRATAGAWCIHERIRARTRWVVDDIFANINRRPRDLILFRNVAIYLDSDAMSLTWRRLFAQLAPGGYLVTGRAERPPVGLLFERVAPSIYRRQ